MRTPKRKRLAQEREQAQRDKATRRRWRAHQRKMQLDTDQARRIRHWFLYYNLDQSLLKWNTAADKSVYGWWTSVAASHPYAKRLIRQGYLHPFGRPSNAAPAFHRFTTTKEQQ